MYKFVCDCGSIDRVYIYVQNIAPELPDSIAKHLELCYWIIRGDNGTADDEDGNYINPIFDKKYINKLCQKFAADFINKKTELWCGECGQQYRVRKSKR